MSAIFTSGFHFPLPTCYCLFPTSYFLLSEKPLRARHDLGQTPVPRARHAQRAPERLEERLDLVVIRPAVEHFEVHVGARSASEPLEEIGEEVGLQVADLLRLDPRVDHRVRAAAEVDCDDPDRLVHRHDEVARTVDAAARAERGLDGLSERYPDVFDCVVLVDVEIAVRPQMEVEA